MKDIIIQVLKGYSTDSEDKPNTSIDFDRIESLADDLIIALKKDLSNQSVSDEEIEKEADKKAAKTKKSPNPPVTDRELMLGKRAFINGAKWMRDTPKKEEKDKRDLLIGLLNHLNKKYMIAMIPTKNEDLVDDYLSNPPIKE